MTSFSNNKEIWMCIVHLLSFSILFCIQVMCLWLPVCGKLNLLNLNFEYIHFQILAIASYELCELVLYSSHVLSWSDQGCRPAPMVAGVSGARSVRSRLPFRPRRNFPASPCSEARIEAQRGRRTWHPWWRHSLMGGKASEMVKLGFRCFSSTEEYRFKILSHHFISYRWQVTLFDLNHTLLWL